MIWTSPPRSRRDLRHQNAPAVDSHEELARYISGRFDASTAALFAVPSRQSDGSIAWTDRLGAEQTTAFKDLTGEEKDRASATLREQLQRVETACDSSSGGQLLLSATTIESPDAIRFANGRPIIAGWGAVPIQLTTPEQLLNHHQATLGPFLSRVEPPRFWVSSVETIPLYSRLYGSRALLAAVLLAALLLAWLLLPGVLRNNYSSLPETDFSSSNRSIQRQIDAVKRSLEQNVCIATTLPRLEAPLSPRTDGGGSTSIPGIGAPGAGGTTIPPGSTTRPGNGTTPAIPSTPGATPGPSGQDQTTPTPGPRRDEALVQPTPPVDPNASPVAPQVNPGAGGAPVLSQLLKKSTVIIVTKSGTGSGFFVSRNHILTNRHVIADADDKYLVGNKTLTQILPADLVGVSDTSKIGGPDFALLKLRSGSSETFLSFADSLPYELQNVIATGYPGFVIREDEAYRRMMNGDVRSVPDAALASGGVTYIQNASGPSPIVLHYATISPGNSGGPLTDECGRVVGINTYVRSNEGPNARMNYALASASAIEFLKRNNVTPTIVSGRCTTATAGVTPAPAPAAPQSPAPETAQPPQTPGTDPGAAKLPKSTRPTPTLPPSTPSTPPPASGGAKK